MTELAGIVGEALAGILSHPLIGIVLRGLVIAAVVIWLASAWWVWRDLGQRTHDSLAPYLGATGVLLATPVFFPLALVVYRLVRPQDPVALEDELALRTAAIEGPEPESTCPGCGRITDGEWRRCPDCGAELTVPCAACGRPVGAGWAICAWCAAELPSA